LAGYLVTGGAGFIGSHITETLLAEGHSVTVLDNFHTGKATNLPAGVENLRVLKGDVRDPESVKEAVRGAEYVLHEAAMVSVAESLLAPAETLNVNVAGTLNVLAAARDEGVQRVVLASSCAVYGDGPAPSREDQPLMPLSPYAASKMAAEGMASSFYYSYGLPVVCLRYFNVFGPRQDPGSPYSGVIAIFSSRIGAGEPVTIHGDGRQTRDFVYVADVVRANLLACRSEKAVGRVMNIGTGRGRNLLELHAILADLSGRAGEIRHDSPRKGDIYHSRSDSSRARALLGFRAQIDFRAGLEQTLAWHRRASRSAAA
jgi:nucleoside-diphosphate-sugar epimerase